MNTHVPTTPLPPGWTESRSLAARILLWFELLALAIGAAQFVAAPETISHPKAAATALAILLATTVLVRVWPQFRPKLRKFALRRAACDTGALLLVAGTMAYATGGVHSPVLPLFLLPLTGAAVALGRGGYTIVAVLVAGAALVLGMTTPGVSIESSSFAVWYIGALAPKIIATTAIAILVEQMQGAERYIQDLSATDRLTGLLNRRAFDEIVAREHRKAERSGQPYCLLIIDVDNVKQLNESLGYDAGNKLLTAVAAAIARSIRATDVAARFGDDEFAVLLIATDVAIASTIGHRIRSHVYSGTISLANRLVRANVHVGLACYPKDRRGYKELLVLADQRMQQERQAQRPV